jgi:hypothetical protein
MKPIIEAKDFTPEGSLKINPISAMRIFCAYSDDQICHALDITKMQLDAWERGEDPFTKLEKIRRSVKFAFKNFFYRLSRIRLVIRDE